MSTFPSSSAPGIERLAAGTVRAAVMVVLIACGSAVPTLAQTAREDGVAVSAAGAGSLDVRLLYAVYEVESPVFRGYVEGAGRAFYPVLYGAAPAAWAGVWMVRGGGDWGDAYRLTIAEAGAVGAAILLKRVIRRPRPYMVLEGVARRTPGHDAAVVERLTPESFPSGHAAVAFALVTSWGLSHPYWYVFAPGAVWAVGVSLDRMWRGMHFPSDVLAGALLGTAIGVGVHALGPHITPAVLEPDGPAEGPPLLRVVVPL